jgi:hypothetical protein
MSKEQQEKPKGVLFGILAYHTEEEYQSFLDKIKNGSEPEIVLVVNAALRFAQSKGAFSLEESELIINTLKIFSQENGEAESN